MKSLSTETATQLLKQKLASSNCYSYSKITYVNDSGVEIDFTDEVLFPYRVSHEGRPPRYANVNFEPASGECDFRVLNYGKKYSPKNTLSAYRDVFKRDRIVKFYDGKYLHGTDTEDFIDVDFSTEDIYHFYSKITAGNLVLDAGNNEGGDLTYFSDLFENYDEPFYDDSFYSPEAYSVVTIDTGLSQIESFQTLRITSATNNINLYVRYSPTLEGLDTYANTSDGWTNLGGLVAGINTFDLNDLQNVRYVQLGFIFNTSDWGSGASITECVLTYTTNVEYVLLGSFLLDDPEFNEKESPEISTISITGRNAWKRALDTKINIRDLSGGVSIDTLIKEIADLSNIPYNNDDIADLSAYGNRTLATGYDDQVSPADIYADILQVIGKDYRLVIDDNNYLKTELRPTNYEVDFVFNYQNYLSAKLGEKSDRKIQRITIQTSNEVLDPLVTLDSDTFVDVASGVLSWAGGAVAKDYEYTLNSGNISITAVEFNNDSTSATFTFTGSGSITITIKGCKFRSTQPTYYNEAVKPENIESKNGFSFREVNPLIISDAEAKSVAEDRIEEFGDAEYNVTINDAYLNPLIEINDSVLLVSESFAETTIYEVLSKEHIVDSEVSKKSKFTLIDTGRDILDQGSFIWDRALFNVGANFDWDSGIIWDALYPIGTTTAEINADENRFVDVDFV